MKRRIRSSKVIFAAMIGAMVSGAMLALWQDGKLWAVSENESQHQSVARLAVESASKSDVLPMNTDKKSKTRQPAAATGDKRAECGKGNVAACVELARERMFESEYDEAKWLVAAPCREGEATACVLFAEIEIALGNLEAAKSALEGQCEKGEVSACKMLEDLLSAHPEMMGGLPQPTDPEQRADYKQAVQAKCDGGDARSCYLLGSLYKLENEEGMTQSAYTNSCEKGSAAGCMASGMLHSRMGENEEAVRYLRQGCGMDNAESCDRLAGVFFRTGDYDAAQEAAQTACRLGFRSSCDFERTIASAKALDE